MRQIIIQYPTKGTKVVPDFESKKLLLYSYNQKCKQILKPMLLLRGVTVKSFQGNSDTVYTKYYDQIENFKYHKVSETLPFRLNDFQLN